MIQFSKVADEYFEQFKESFSKAYGKFQIKEDGRIPGAGDLIRSLLNQAATTEDFSFEKLDDIVWFTKVNGLKSARERMFELAQYPNTKYFPPSDFEEDKGKEAC